MTDCICTLIHQPADALDRARSMEQYFGIHVVKHVISAAYVMIGLLVLSMALGTAGFLLWLKVCSLEWLFCFPTIIAQFINIMSAGGGFSVSIWYILSANSPDCDVPVLKKQVSIAGPRGFIQRRGID